MYCFGARFKCVGYQSPRENVNIMQKRWLVKTSDTLLAQSLVNSLKIHPIIAQLLINRGLSNTEHAKLFMSGDMANLYNPFLLADMDRAVSRLEKAKKNGEKILIYGDYDVDGVTSSALLRRLFKRVGVEATNYIPHRMDEGYGLNQGVVDSAKEVGASIVVAVDCGINAFGPIASLQSQGIDVIVIDHHEPDGDKIPNAHAVIDPKRPDCIYPFKHLCAVGLAAKLMQAMLGDIPEEELDLVALGTIADVVPLFGENRIFVKKGLPVLQRTTKKGLRALLEAAKISGKPMKPYYIGFILGPRLNAAGRMDSAITALNLLLTEDKLEATALANDLEKHNQERQRMQQEVVADAMAMIEKDALHQDSVIVVHKQGWHKGVLGIVASRILEKYYRPAVVISVKEGLGTGSARSIEGFHLHEALTQCAVNLEAFGGHKRAAGVTVKEENIVKLRDGLNAVATGQLTDERLVPVLDIDVKIALSDIDLALTTLIASLQPHGECNPAVLLMTEGLTIKSMPQVLGRDTIKFWVTDGVKTFSAVGFGMGSLKDMLSVNAKVDLAYTVDIDDWNKLPTVQLMLKDVRISKI